MERRADTAALKVGGQSAVGDLVRHLVHKVFSVQVSKACQRDAVSRAYPPVSVHAEAQLHRPVVGAVQLRAELDAGIVYAGSPPVHALGVRAAAHAALDVNVLVRVRVIKVPAGIGAGQGGGVAEAPRPDLRAVKGAHGPFCLVLLPVIHPQPPGVHFQDKPVVFAQAVVVAAVRAVLLVALDVVVVGIVGERKAVPRGDLCADTLDAGVLPDHVPLQLRKVAVAWLAYAAHLQGRRRVRKAHIVQHEQPALHDAPLSLPFPVVAENTRSQRRALFRHPAQQPFPVLRVDGDVDAVAVVRRAVGVGQALDVSAHLPGKRVAVVAHIQRQPSCLNHSSPRISTAASVRPALPPAPGCSAPPRR